MLTTSIRFFLRLRDSKKLRNTEERKTWNIKKRFSSAKFHRNLSWYHCLISSPTVSWVWGVCGRGGGGTGIKRVSARTISNAGPGAFIYFWLSEHDGKNTFALIKCGQLQHPFTSWKSFILPHRIDPSTSFIKVFAFLQLLLFFFLILNLSKTDRTILIHLRRYGLGVSGHSVRKTI